MKSQFFNNFFRSPGAVLAAVAMAAVMVPAHANNLVVNGGFEQTSNGAGQVGYNTTLTGWNITGGYTFVYTPSSADTTGAPGVQGTVKLWGPGDGSNNGLPATSPLGGSFIAQDPGYAPGAPGPVMDPLTQVLTGLTVGEKYTVSFDWAAAQQFGFTGPQTEGWDVGFGSETQSTGLVANAGLGFVPWTSTSFTFTADNTSDTLSFLAIGGPNGEPPFALLDGVSVTGTSPVPEPGSLALILTGFAGVGGMVRSRFMKTSV